MSLPYAPPVLQRIASRSSSSDQEKFADEKHDKKVDVVKEIDGSVANTEEEFDAKVIRKEEDVAIEVRRLHYPLTWKVAYSCSA